MPDEQPAQPEPSQPGPSRAEARRKPDTRGRSGRRKGRPRRRHTVARVLGATVVVLAMVTGLSVVFLYRSLNGDLNVDDLDPQLGTDRPTAAPVEGPQDPLNILVMGDDTREGAGNDIDQEAGGGSDTTILFHLSADRENAYGVSIPRDTLVDRPECYTEDGDTIPAESGAMWNVAYSVGGPACTMRQFEQLTGIKLDNYVVVDFQGFQDMVDAIDGVEVCIPEDISDPAHGINIPAGTREIEGKEALNYVRARYTLGDGSDIGRIKRQQAFIAAMAKKVVSGNVLARPDRVVNFLGAAIDSLTTDFENLWQLGKVGYSFQHIGLDNIKFITVPFQYSEVDPGRVEWLPEAERLWQRVINDEPLSRRLQAGVITAGDVPGTSNPGEGSGGAGPDDGPSGSPSPDVDPERAAELEAAGLCA
ncbi:LCP family protein [Nocardioides marmotae]|uniref:LCP family protein n=1 Tax=Nocardioides marmotae TaxID=2663857 RepID=UPI0012B537A9|nr:LCP family protein [Nocardioides marmotae]MBC9734485.1 LCP family protein [Nocardioides marmotae]MTB85585.1 LytR family transcriptional regulator [Nocardioides marmotae]